MRFRREFVWGIVILLGLQVITSFSAIGLLSRMSPAIADILDENEYTVEAAEEMLAAIALAGEPGAGSRFRLALDRARDNVTEAAEPTILESIAATSPAALDGDPSAVRTTIGSIEELVRVNREAMRRADVRARQLGSAGAWAAVLLAIVTIAVGVLVVRRITTNVLDPVSDLVDTLEARRQGDPFRRCQTAGALPEMAQVLGSVNRLLDREQSA